MLIETSSSGFNYGLDRMFNSIFTARRLITIIDILLNQAER